MDYSTAPVGSIVIRKTLMRLYPVALTVGVKPYSHNLVGIYLDILSRNGFSENNIADILKNYGLTGEGEYAGWTQYADIEPERHEYFQKFLDEDMDSNEMNTILEEENTTLEEMNGVMDESDDEDEE